MFRMEVLLCSSNRSSICSIGLHRTSSHSPRSGGEYSGVEERVPYSRSSEDHGDGTRRRRGNG